VSLFLFLKNYLKKYLNGENINNLKKKNGIKQIINFAIIVKNFSILIELILKELIKLNLK
jgi:hypothetical protein